MSTNRICTKCGQTKPLTMEYFHRAKNTKSGFHGGCRVCWNLYFKKYMRTHPANPETVKRNAAKQREMKTWRWYGPYKQHKPQQIKFLKRYLIQLQSRIAYWKNPEHSRNVDRNYRQQNPEILQKSYKRYHHKNQEALRIKSLEYARAHPFLTRARSANRWAQKRGCQGTVIAQDIAGIYHQQRGRCFYCSTKLDKHFQVDHKDPLSRKGPNIPANICCTCHKCNMDKKAKTAEEFIKQRAA